MLLNDTLLVFMRWPDPGQVKSRLSAEVGEKRAAHAYSRMLRTVLDTVHRWQSERARVIVCATPTERVAHVRALCGDDVHVLAQEGEDLGARMAHAFREAFDAGARSVVAIGTDCIDVTPAHLDQAFSSLSLGYIEAVLGPTYDGGYWLIGLNLDTLAPFEGVPWGTDKVCEVTREQLSLSGLRTRELELLRDLDTRSDLEVAGRLDLLDGA